MSSARPLSPSERSEALHRLSTEEFDILVIGGGVVGGGAALDAATRGLKVGLVEARDYASGTSSREVSKSGSLKWSERPSLPAIKPRGPVLNLRSSMTAKPTPPTFSPVK